MNEVEFGIEKREWSAKKHLNVLRKSLRLLEEKGVSNAYGKIKFKDG